MILNILIFALLLVKYRKDNEVIKFILITYWLSLLVFGLKLLELQAGNITYFISDERGYYFLTLDFFSNKDRVVWVFINQFLKNYDVLGFLGVKLLNIPIGIVTIISLSQIFDNKIPYLKFLLYLPYLLILFTLDIRDILILLIIFQIILLTKNINLKNTGIILLYLSVLFFLRPLFVFLIIFIILFVKFAPIFLARYSLKDGLKYTVPLIFIVLLGYILFKNRIDTIINSITMQITYRYIDNNATLFNSRGDGGAYSGHIFKYFFFRSIPRYILTPIPTSLISRLLNGGSKQWGITDDFIRTINQFIYYYLLLYLFFNLKYLNKIIKELNEIQLIAIGFLLSYMPIYAFYLLGVAQQRLKIPFQFAIFIIYYLILTYKTRIQQRITNDEA